MKYILIPALVGGSVGLAVVSFNKPAPTVDKPGFAHAVKRAAPAVVNIYSSQTITPPICQLPRFREWCRVFSGDGSRRMQSSLGSGVVVRSDGYILTNNHVIANADEILVGFNNGQATTASIVGSDPGTDLAVIKVQATGLSPINVESNQPLEVGDIALAIGNPFGIGQTVSSGIISAKGRAGISPSPYDDFVQTDAAINPGNSGGALIDSDGNLIGINTLIYSSSGGSEGIGFAIPAQLALSVLEEIIEHGKVTRGWLGIELANTPPLGSGVGLEVTRVLNPGPAYLAGLRVGDVIIAINEEPTVSSVTASRQIAHSPPDSQIVLRIIRNGQQGDLQVKVGEKPSL